MNKKDPKILIVAQDLRISGTSEGIVSRSFIARLRQIYPQAILDIVYFRNHQNEDRLDLLPVNNIQQYFIKKKIPLYITWLNKLWWRINGTSLNDLVHLKKFRRVLSKLDYKGYDHIFIRSSGQEYEVIRALQNLPILKDSVINFHDPYPVFWDTGSNRPARKIEFAQFQEMWQIVRSARACISPSHMLSQDLEHLYGSRKKFFVLPHQYVPEVFKNETNNNNVRKRRKEVIISYQGAVQLGRNLDILLEAYIELVNNYEILKSETELNLRLRGGHTKRLMRDYNHSNINFLKPVEFAISSFEQGRESDILIILENCAAHSNILVGKAPLLAHFKKAVLSLSPERSEMRRILQDDKYCAKCNDKEEIKLKLSNLIAEILEGKRNEQQPFGDYFELENFTKNLEQILAL